MKIAAKYRNFTISAKLFSDNGVPMPTHLNTGALHYRYRLAVKNEDGARCVFDYYGSADEFEKKQNELDEKSLLFGFMCALLDAFDSLIPFDRWRSLYAPHANFDLAKQVYKSLQTSSSKMDKLGIKLGHETEEMIRELNAMT
jgi:hypothetical protein